MGRVAALAGVTTAAVNQISDLSTQSWHNAYVRVLASHRILGRLSRQVVLEQQQVSS